ncbi:MAG: FHA domain-containing protein [Myxococcaceae bacterium]|nr:FHA domain-containing protein [Myxococcaceae bacterium]
MLTLRIVGPGGVTERALAAPFVDVGRDEQCPVVLTGHGVSRRHLRLIPRGGIAFFRDLDSSLGVLLVRQGEARQVALGRLEPGDALRVGAFSLSVEGLGGHAPLLAEDRARLEALRAGDEAREVFADWLEAAGRPQEAAYVRAELALHRCAPGSPDLRARLNALRALTRQVPMAFRAGVSRPRVEGCEPVEARAGSACPTRWDALDLTDDVGVRRCPACMQDVFFCDTVDEAQELGACRQRVAVEVSRPRRPGDVRSLPRR